MFPSLRLFEALYALTGLASNKAPRIITLQDAQQPLWTTKARWQLQCAAQPVATPPNPLPPPSTLPRLLLSPPRPPLFTR
eukprot:7716292-Pyramimonas_sp.AAC.1